VRIELSAEDQPPRIDYNALESVDAVVNLAGSPIARRWTTGRMNELRNSRMHSTALAVHLVEVLPRAAILISGSAVGYYGDRRDETLDESSTRGAGFLAEVAWQWELCANGIDPRMRKRVALLRTGVVLSGHGGALPQMLRPFRLGVGGRIGSGRQWLAWIDIEDMVRAIAFLIDTPTASGPFNLVAPNPATNAEFTRTVAALMHRPALFPVPAFVLKMILGQMAEETLLASQRAIPEALRQAGFSFTKPTLRESLARFV
jgi:uncharacterized protein (TIGR01777 family)